MMMTKAFINGDPLHDIIIPFACCSTDNRIDNNQEDNNKLISDDETSKVVGSTSTTNSRVVVLPCTICSKATWRYSCMGCCYSDLYKIDPLYKETLQKYDNKLPNMIQSIEDGINKQYNFTKRVKKEERIATLRMKKDNISKEIITFKKLIKVLEAKIDDAAAVISSSNRDNNKESLILKNDRLEEYSQELDNDMLAESDVRNDISAFINDGDAAAHGDSLPYYESNTSGLNSFHAYHRLRANIHALTAHRNVLCQQLKEVYPVLWIQGYTPSGSWCPYSTTTSRSCIGYTGDGSTDSNNPTPVDSIASLSESRMLMSRSWLTSSQLGTSSSDHIGDLRSIQGAITKYSQLVPAIACISQILQINLPFPCQFGVIGNNTTTTFNGYNSGGTQRQKLRLPCRRQLPLEPRILHPYSHLPLPLVPVSNSVSAATSGLASSSYNRQHSGLDPHKMLREDIRFLTLICGTGLWSEEYHMDDLSAARELINSPDIGRLYIRARLDQSISISNTPYDGGDVSHIDYSHDTTTPPPAPAEGGGGGGTQEQQECLTSGFIDEIEWNILD